MLSMIRAALAAITQSPIWLALVGVWRTNPWLTVAVVTLVALNAVLPTAASLAAGELVRALPAAVSSGLDAGPPATVVLAVAALGALFVVQQVVGPLQGNAADALGRRYQAWVHRRLMRAALRPASIRHLEEPALHDKVTQARGDGGMGPSGLPPRLASLTNQRLRGIVALFIVAHFSLPLALLLAAVRLHHLWWLQSVHRELIAVRWRRTPAMRYGEYFGGLSFSPDVAKEIRIFGMGNWLGERYERAWLEAIAELWVKRRGVVPRMALANAPVLVLELAAIWVIGSAAVAGQIDLGAVLVYVNAVFQTFALGEVSDSAVAVQRATESLRPLAELEQIVAHDPRLVLPGTRPADDLPRHAIRFENVAFQYPGRETPVFQNLTLEIPAGRSLALVGANGAGKTTLIKLLSRLYDPTEGRITVDGIDLREVDARAWQRRVAAIFQDFVKYPLPAYDNVGLGAAERLAARDAVESAARRAGALELIEGLPKGWETVLSRRFAEGADLSGGQWQRIAMARALFAASMGAPVLIMDEPTAHLDVRAEAAFYDSFLDLTHGLTTIVVSHRFSTVRRADLIVVLDSGGVLEQGTHDELMRRGGTYAYMFGLQAQRFADDTAVGATA